MSIVKISVIFIFTLFSYFSYSSTACANVLEVDLNVAESNSDVLNTARNVISKRRLSNKEERTILHLYNFIQEQTEPLTPKQIFDNVAFDLEQAGFNLYELWDIAHSNVLQMSFKDRRAFKKLLKGGFSNDELGLPWSYPKNLKTGGSINSGSIVYSYHYANSYRNPENTAVNNSHSILAMQSPRTHQRIFGWADFGLGHGYTTRRIKEPLERFITGRLLVGRNTIRERRRVFAVYFLYKGRVIKEYVPFFDRDMQWISFGLNKGEVHPVKRTRTTGKILPKHRRDIALLRYFLQRFKATRVAKPAHSPETLMHLQMGGVGSLLPETLYQDSMILEVDRLEYPLRRFID